MADVRGEIEKDGNVLLIRRIHTKYRLRVAEQERLMAERVRDIHADSCPVARTLKGCVEITTELEFV